MLTDDYLRLASLVAACQVAIATQIALLHAPNPIAAATARARLGGQIAASLNVAKALEAGKGGPDVLRAIAVNREKLQQATDDALLTAWGV